MWFGKGADPRHGTPDDPRLLLIGVRADSAQFMTVEKPKAVVLFEMIKGRLTGEAVDIAETQEVSGARIREGR